MSFWVVVLGTIGQLVLAMFLFMYAAFAGGGRVSGNAKSLSKSYISFLDISIYALPASCVISAAIVVYCYNNGGSSDVYWWYALPLALAVVYTVFLSKK